ncbi:MAG TPA: PAS domain-containing sensor histidine kinase [Ferruginibacter sp.]|nr:PAS domain-containing sensor histidine kinase [Ferruginibacter sp.]
MSIDKKYNELLTEVEELKSQLSEANEIINAIRRGEVDAFIIKNEDENEIYTLKSADKTFRIFIEKMSEGAITINKDGIILYCNSSFADLINSPLSKVIGCELERFIPVVYKNLVAKLLEKAWDKEECKAEIVLQGENNISIPVLLSISTLEIDEGLVLSILITDLSFQKESEEQLLRKNKELEDAQIITKSLNDGLERTIKERTEELIKEQKRAMEKKDEFITIASHELKTPVTSIKGYIQVLRFNFEKEGNAAAAQLLGKVDIQINKLTTLISDLLDVKKIETGKLHYREELFDYNELVKEIIEETGRVLTKHTVKYQLDETALVYGDRNKIGQVITNFIDNAGKYSPSNTDIIIETFKEGSKVKLAVSDSGIGIPKSQQPMIFDRFYRVSGTKENTYSGLGLGLYISFEIIKRHQGNIGVESEEGKGSTFYFELPISN